MSGTEIFLAVLALAAGLIAFHYWRKVRKYNRWLAELRATVPVTNLILPVLILGALAAWTAWREIQAKKKTPSPHGKKLPPGR